MNGPDSERSPLGFRCRLLSSAWSGQWGIPLALYSDRHAAFKYNARQKPVPVETTQFARVMRELGIQQIFALLSFKPRDGWSGCWKPSRTGWSPNCAWGASTIDQAKEVLQEFLPKINARFALAAEQPETAYRPVSTELSLTETICIKDTRKVARDNTVKYHWRGHAVAAAGIPGPQAGSPRVSGWTSWNGPTVPSRDGSPVPGGRPAITAAGWGRPPTPQRCGMFAGQRSAPLGQALQEGAVCPRVGSPNRTGLNGGCPTGTPELPPLNLSKGRSRPWMTGARPKTLGTTTRPDGLPEDKASSGPVAPDAFGRPWQARWRMRNSARDVQGAFPPGHRPWSWAWTETPGSQGSGRPRKPRLQSSGTGSVVPWSSAVTESAG